MEDALSEQQLRILRCRANGVDHITGAQIPYQMQQDALTALHKLDRERKADEERVAAAIEAKRQADAAREEAKRQALAQEEISKRSLATTFELKSRELDISHEVEQRKLDIEEQRVMNDRATIVLRMLEVAKGSDIGLERMLGTLSDMGLVPESRRLAVAPDSTPTPVPDLAEIKKDS